MNELLGVRVELRNDDGASRVEYAEGADVDEAVGKAVTWAREETGDDSWEANDWEAA